MPTKIIILRNIILANLKIALFSFGGGVAVISLVHKEFIEKYKLTSNKNFNNMVILANALPGPTIFQIALHISYEAGKKLGLLLALIINLTVGPALLIGVVVLANKLLPIAKLQLISKAILPAIIGMLLAFTIQLFLTNTKESYNWIVYGFIFFGTLTALLLNIKIIIILAILIFCLCFMRFL